MQEWVEQVNTVMNERVREGVLLDKGMEKLRAGVIGAGNIGALFDTPDHVKILTHAHAYAADERFEFVGFYDADSDRCFEAAKRWGCRAFGSLQELLDEVDVVSCTVPDEFHYSVLAQIGESQVPLVFAEKPLAKDCGQAEAIKKLFEKKGVRALVNYSRRYLPEFAELKKKLPEFGKFLRGSGYYGKGICHNGSHMLDFLRFLFGRDVPESWEVLGGVKDCYPEDPSVDAILHFPGGPFFLQAVDCRFVTLFELDLLFERMRVRILEGGVKIEFYEVALSGEYAGYFNYKLTEERTVDYSNALFGALQNIVSVLSGSAEPLCSLQDGLEALRLCEGMRESYEKNFAVCQGSGGSEYGSAAH